MKSIRTQTDPSATPPRLPRQPVQDACSHAPVTHGNQRSQDGAQRWLPVAVPLGQELVTGLSSRRPLMQHPETSNMATAHSTTGSNMAAAHPTTGSNMAAIEVPSGSNMAAIEVPSGSNMVAIEVPDGSKMADIEVPSGSNMAAVEVPSGSNMAAVEVLNQKATVELQIVTERSDDEEEEEEEVLFPGTGFLSVVDVVQEDSAQEELLIEVSGHRSPPAALYHGPAFPPSTSAAPLPAQDQASALGLIQRGDALENRLLEWVEQQVMTRVICRMYSPPPPDPALNETSGQSEDEEDSVTSGSHRSHR
ncbi:TALPID3 protein-like isoform X1 [Gadus macrocephalus]|uniref:TALPID3 protein-like isoform X1 n=1 Tax=Gadus macrocephalus TaxID=80720 RepID=UPI0028CB2060|nr:TALPID3 protein-like isoform X1 [Gadus macrocephalus]XP_059907595.1 TALPID3 protein-like isoform X1 [Gadus macrocephalus]